MSFLLTINLPLVGEEGVYTNAALEMLFFKQYNSVMLYGNLYPRPALYNWLIILFNKLSSPINILLSARIVTILATTIMATTVFISVKKLLPSDNKANINLAWLATAIFLSGDLLFKRGWLAYADPLFAALVFLSTVFLVIGTLTRRNLLLLFANICVFLGFLAKVPTAYVFYITTMLILIIFDHHKYLLQPKSIILHTIFIIILIVWNIDKSSFIGLQVTITHMKKLIGLDPNPESNLLKNILLFPIQTWMALLPSSLIATFAYKKFTSFNFIHNSKIIVIISSIILINFIPYWITSQSHIRYILPLYPWFAILMAFLITKAELTTQATISLFITVIIKYFIAIYWFPYQYKIKLGDTEAIAKNILAITENHRLYINNFAAPGLRLAGAINKLNWPKQPLTSMLPTNLNSHQHEYFLIEEQPLEEIKHLYTDHNGNNIIKLIKIYKLNKDRIFLYFIYKDLSITLNNLDYT